jgi:acyl-CoA thioester hydrolase
VPFGIELVVRYAECDMQGHVFNAHYLTWFDMAHSAALGGALGYSYSELIERRGVDVVVAEAGVRYLAAARFEDRLSVEALFEAPSTSSLTTRFSVERDGELIASGFCRHVCVDAGTMVKRPWPEDVRAALERGAQRATG